MGIELTDEQILATYQGERWFRRKDKQTFEITGAAGTGKTTLVAYLIDRLGLSYNQVLFTAFMGKAVSQLAKQGLPAKTLHSAMYHYIKVPAIDEKGHLIYNKHGNVKMVGTFRKKESLGSHIKLVVLDEGSTVDTKLAEDLLSFGIPVIVLGDLNQLPPPFGRSFFLREPDVSLTQIIRQKEGDPIIWLSQRVLHDEPLNIGVYGNSAVISKNDLTDYQLKQADIILTGTQKLRSSINMKMRAEIYGFKHLEFPYIGEKVICRKNDWDRTIDEGIYLTNGTTGTISYVERESFNGKSIKIDFKPDFGKREVRNLTINYKRLLTQDPEESNDETTFFLSDFEYAYAITTHSSQGSQWPKVLFMAEKFLDKDTRKKFMYTAITRASESITVVI